MQGPWRIPAAIVVCGLLAHAAPIAGSDPPDSWEQALDAENKRAAYSGLIGGRMADPSLTSPIGPPGLAIQFTTDTKDRRARAKIGLRLGNDLFFDVKFIVPAGDSEAEPIDLDGLRRSAVLDLGIHYLAWNPRLDAGRAKAIRDEYLTRHPDSKKYILSLNALKGEPDLRRRFLQAITWSTAVFAALRAKIGRQDFTYADSSFESVSAQKTSAALEAAAGILVPAWGYFGASFEAQRFYEAGSSAELILPYRGGPAEQIKTLVLEPPGRRSRTRLRVEYRRTIGPFAAVNPRLSYFPKERAALVELPLYAFRNPEAGLNGGVNLSWISRNGGRVGLALFIGSTFSLTPD